MLLQIYMTFLTQKLYIVHSTEDITLAQPKSVRLGLGQSF